MGVLCQSSDPLEIESCHEYEADCGAFVLYSYEEKYVCCRLEMIYPIVLHKYYPLVNALLGFRTEMQT